jgi:hypothetical protein
MFSLSDPQASMNGSSRALLRIPSRMPTPARQLGLTEWRAYRDPHVPLELRKPPCVDPPAPAPIPPFGPGVSEVFSKCPDVECRSGAVRRASRARAARCARTFSIGPRDFRIPDRSSQRCPSMMPQSSVEPLARPAGDQWVGFRQEKSAPVHSFPLKGKRPLMGCRTILSFGSLSRSPGSFDHEFIDFFLPL